MSTKARRASLRWAPTIFASLSIPLIAGACTSSGSGGAESRAGRVQSAQQTAAGRGAGTGGRSQLLPLDTPVPPDTIVTDAVSTRSQLGAAQLSVTDVGDARYHIPLWVPPGRNGVQPELSLDYSSNAQNGFYGVGWSLSGLPRITRCRKHGEPPITWGNPVQSDEFCLNGEYLVPTASDMTTFHPLRDDFSLVTAKNRSPLGPATFEQRTKDGRILTFGGSGMTVSGPIDGQYAPAYFGWPLTRIEDRAGNFVTISYAPNGSVELLPVQIDYTGSASNPSTTRSVKFVFESRSDVDDLYVSGMEFKRGQRLSRLEMYAPTSVGKALVHSFDLHYTQSPTTGRSLLHEVDECAVDAAAAAAQSPTATMCRHSILTYTVGDLGFDDIDTAIANLQSTQLAVLDIDADGRADIFYPGSDGNYHFRLSTGTGFGAEQTTPIVVSATGSFPGAQFAPRPADINGDGHTDIFVRTGAPTFSGFAAYLAVPNASSPGGWSFSATPVWSGSGDFFYDIADLNGDHYPDLVRTAANPPTIACSSFGTCPREAFLEHVPAGKCSDGAPCYACGSNLCLGTYGVCCATWPGTAPVEALINSGGTLPADSAAQSFGSRPANVDPAWVHLLADLRGDGRTQLLMPTWPATPTTPSTTAIGDFTDNELEGWGAATASTTLPAVKSSSCTGCTPQVVQPFFVDVNGDGLTDALYGFGNSYLDPAAGSLLINTGHSMQSPRSVPAIVPTALITSPARKIDWNLDGKADVLQQLVYGGDPHAGGILKPAFQVLYNRGDGTLVQASLAPQVDMKDGFPTSTLQVLDVDGDGLDDFVSFIKGSLHVFRHRGVKPDLLTQSFGGLGPSVGVSYKVLQGTDASSDCKVPIRCVTGQLWVVDSQTIDNGLGSVNTYQHTFQNGRADLAQWGLLGFKTHAIHDLQSGATSTRTFDLSAWTQWGRTFYPRAGRPTGETMTVVDPQSGVTRTETRTSTYFVKAQSYGTVAVLPATVDELVTDTLTDGVVETVSHYTSNVSAASEYDDYGNLLSISEVWPLENLSQSTEYSYKNRPDVWLVSLLRHKSVFQLVGNEGAIRETGYEFDDKGQLFRTTDNPGNDNGTSFDPIQSPSDGVQTLYTEFDRNSNGLVETVVVSDGLNPGYNRVTTVHYDSAEGMFPVVTVDPLGHSVSTAYEPSLGVRAVLVDANGLSTTTQYDPWGRPRAEHPPTGDDRAISYLPSSSAMPFGGTEDSRAGGADVVIALDSLGRVSQTATSGRADGKTVYATTAYAALGRPHATSRPHFQGGALSATTTDHDVLGRVVRVTYPDGSRESTSYRGRTRTTIDPAGNKKVVRIDTRGRPVSSAETARGRRGQVPPHVITTTLAYGPFDTLEYVTDTAGNAVHTIYDRVGRPRVQLDPDAGGAREYLYNAFGERTHDIRGGTWDGKTFTGGDDEAFVYDALGRLTEQIGSASRVLEWDTAENGVGKLGLAAFGNTVLSFTYDSASRLATKSWTVGNDAPISVGYGYDSTNRVATIAYPVVPPPPGTPLVQAGLVVQNHYSSGGQLTGVTDANSSVAYWTLEGSDATDTFLTSKLGDGVETTWSEDPTHPGWLNTIVSTNGSATIQSLAYHWDGHGRLRGRDDIVDGTTETFDYDGVDRLTQWTWSGVSARSIAYQYDDLGNLTGKVIQQGAGTNVTYAYDKTHFGPHQPCAVNATSCPAAGAVFAYDSHGNQTAAPGRAISYNEYDLPSSVTTGAGKYTFAYDALLHRLSRTNPDGATISTFGDLYERRIDAQGNTHHVWKVQAHQPVAQIDTLASGGAFQSRTTTYLLFDREGSVDTLIDANGNVTHAKYEPFGARVSAADPSLPGAPAPDGVRAGFMGDDHDDELGLIDMRGRIYDPVQQRFLSKDPVAPKPTKGQALNPYAYVFNNPLNWTDPTGFVAEGGDDDGGDDDEDTSGSGQVGGTTTAGPGTGDVLLAQNENATQGASGQEGPYHPELTDEMGKGDDVTAEPTPPDTSDLDRLLGKPEHVSDDELLALGTHQSPGHQENTMARTGPSAIDCDGSPRCPQLDGVDRHGKPIGRPDTASGLDGLKDDYVVIPGRYTNPHDPSYNPAFSGHGQAWAIVSYGDRTILAPVGDVGPTDQTNVEISQHLYMQLVPDGNSNPRNGGGETITVIYLPWIKH